MINFSQREQCIKKSMLQVAPKLKRHQFYHTSSMMMTKNERYRVSKMAFCLRRNLCSFNLLYFTHFYHLPQYDPFPIHSLGMIFNFAKAKDWLINKWYNHWTLKCTLFICFAPIYRCFRSLLIWLIWLSAWRFTWPFLFWLLRCNLLE